MIDIIAEIVKVQEARKLNDTQFCKLLGQTGGNWSRLKNRKRQPTNDFLADVLLVMPELWDEIYSWMIARVIKKVWIRHNEKEEAQKLKDGELKDEKR